MQHSFTVIKKETKGSIHWIAMSLEIVGCVGVGNTAEEAIAVLSANEIILMHENSETTQSCCEVKRELSCLDQPEEKESTRAENNISINDEIPEMVTIKEASNRTGLSYDFLRKQCIQGKIVHIIVGNGKRLINFGKLKEKLMNSYGSAD